MLSLALRSTLLSEDPFTLSGINSFLTWQDANSGQAWLYAASSATGTLSTFGLDEGAGLRAPVTTSISGNGSDFRAADLAMIGASPDQQLLVSRVHTQQVNTFDVTSGGGLVNQTLIISPLAGPVTKITSVTVEGTDFLITGTRDAPGLNVFEWSAPDTPILRDTVTDHAKVAVANTSDLETVTVEGTPYVITGSSADGAISSFALAANGEMALVDTLGAKDGLWVSGLDSLSTVEAHGDSFVAVAATNSSSLTLIRVNPMGVFFVEDHENDSLTSRFQNIDAVAGASIGARGFLFAGGADDGISLLEILPDYSLIAHEPLVNMNGGALENISALATATFPNEIQVAAAGQPGVTLASLDTRAISDPLIGTQGADNLSGGSGNDLLWGDAGNDTLSGGAGDDILMGGAGADRMTGGAGRDTFLLSPNIQGDVITDFSHGEDLIDPTRWGRIHDPQSLTIIGRPDGAEIRHGEFHVRLYTDDGSMLSADDFTASDFIF